MSRPGSSVAGPAAAAASVDRGVPVSGRERLDTPQVFWPWLAEALAAAVDASYAMIVIRGKSDEPLKMIARWPDAPPPAQINSLMASVDAAYSSAVAEKLVVLAPADRAGAPGRCIVGSALDRGDGNPPCVALLFCGGPVEEGALRSLALLSAEPRVFVIRRQLDRAARDLGNFSSVLDTLMGLNTEVTFIGAAIRFCNDVAATHRCDRVSLGWLENNTYVRLKAISHTENFDSKMEAVRTLEFAMEEAIDQDDEILSPPWSIEDRHVTRDHQAYAANFGAPILCSLPLRMNGDCVGVVTCERREGAFTEDDVRMIRALCDLCTRRLLDLERANRRPWIRAADFARRNLARLVGFEHTGAKATAAAVSLALAIVFFGWAPYRVEAPFLLQAEEMASVPAPFAGYIGSVQVRPGDKVSAGDTLMQMDSRDLLLEVAGASADYQRYLKEADKSRAEDHLAEMQIALALANQAKARLDLLQYRVEKASVTAPVGGVVAEGDLRNKIGEPINQGDVLFAVVNPAKMYVELRVSEKDIHDIRENAAGEIAFASRPRMKFPVRVTRIEPVAQPDKSDNIFIVRCELAGPSQAWWRPGMSGVAKVRVGWRNIFWIFTHRTMDFLRMHLWW